MENKYQKALKNMVCHLNNSDGGKFKWKREAIKDVNTLQELIDDYEQLSETIIRAVDYLIANGERDNCYIDTEEKLKEWLLKDE